MYLALSAADRSARDGPDGQPRGGSLTVSLWMTMSHTLNATVCLILFVFGSGESVANSKLTLVTFKIALDETCARQVQKNHTHKYYNG